MRAVAVGAAARCAGHVELLHLFLALVILAASWVLVAQLLGIGAGEGASTDRLTHGD